VEELYGAWLLVEDVGWAAEVMPGEAAWSL
jgi:hypothetical protein